MDRSGRIKLVKDKPGQEKVENISETDHQNFYSTQSQDKKLKILSQFEMDFLNIVFVHSFKY